MKSSSNTFPLLISANYPSPPAIFPYAFFSQCLRRCAFVCPFAGSSQLLGSSPRLRRLDGLLSDNGDSSRTDQLWSFAEFLSPEPDEQNAESVSLFSNLVDVPGILARRREICRMAGKLNPQCPQTANGRMGRMSSRISEDCYREMKEQCERQQNAKGTAETLTEKPLGGNAPAEAPIKMAGNVQWLIRRPPLKTTPSGMEDVKALRSKGGKDDEQPKNGEEGTEIGVRDFFPEVWLFNDFNIGMDGSKELRLNSTPHSVTEWHFLATFWSAGRSGVCHSPSQSLITQKNVFMDVEVPLHVYVNESVNVHIAVSAANLTQNRPLSVCFHGLSPKVCGDVGREGTFGETDFTRVVLTPENPVQLKNFFVRFLRHGMHNLSFELRSEDVLKGHDWHCRDSATEVFDRIVKQIQVKRRVDVEEHFRQIVVYKRKRAEEEETDEAEEGEEGQRHGEGARGEELTLEQILDPLDQPTTTTAAPSPRPSLLTSSPDVISYSMLQPFLPDRTDQQRDTVAAEPVQTKVLINAGGRKVYNLGVEFSKFVPSFPPALSTELLSVASPLDPRGSAPLQRVRNRSPLNTFNGEERSERAVRSSGTVEKENRQKRHGQIPDPSERPLQGYSLPNLLKELALLTYELKSLRTMMTVGVGDGERGEGEEKPTTESIEWTERREQLLGNLLAELLTFSDCEFRLRECAFGEFGRPKEKSERNLILTTLATSLLFHSVLNGTDGGKGTETQFGAMGGGMHAQFNDPSEQRLFLETLFVQTVMDCSAYACAAESWKHLHSSFYRSVDLDKRYDVRLIAALAYMSTAATRSIMRSRLATSTLRDDKAPFWGFVEGFAKKGPTDGLLEQSLQKSSNVLANALALLAYTREHSVYRYWKNEFDFEALSNWLVEQQDSRRQYENALDTFFASRALFQFASVNAARHVRLALLGSVQGNFSIPSAPSLSRQFNENELPFSLSVTPSASRMQIETKGDARLLLGVRVLVEKRRRSRREPSDAEPVTLDLVQSRTQTNFIQQTVTIKTHSQLIRSLQIEHGLFTGFTSHPHLVQILNSSVHFQAGPRVSFSAVHFVLSNLTKEEAIVYTVALIEPDNPYSPTDLAPIAITANYHQLTLGQLIALPDNLDFVSTSAEMDSLDSLLKRAPRHRRSKKHRRSRGHHHAEHQHQRGDVFGGEADQNGQFASSGPPAKSFLTRLDSAHSPGPPNSRNSFMQMMVLDRSRQPSADVIETVCLQNGVCTCAETTCTLRCSSCARLTFREICMNIYSPHGQMQKFALTFRLNPNSVPQTVKISQSSAEYTVLENVRVVEWQSSSLDRPELLTVWVRKCNFACLNLLKETNGKSPRFMLIGNPQGLFDEGELAADLEERGEGTVSQNSGRAADRMVRTHYVMYDNDRLLRSTDCHELFGRVADESCENEKETDGKGRTEHRCLRFPSFFNSMSIEEIERIIPLASSHLFSHSQFVRAEIDSFEEAFVHNKRFKEFEGLLRTNHKTYESVEAKFDLQKIENLSNLTKRLKKLAAHLVEIGQLHFEKAEIDALDLEEKPMSEIIRIAEQKKHEIEEGRRNGESKTEKVTESLANE
ncbi:hypothetical protein niasHS_010734 [Heterodera schachtii]|uniref:Alpha-2-macroglobulin domain-containing protein n=1 Tax=Heterodera schachtii TaxID=97005 RepID=A0ABD2IUZ0_HETSC